MAGSIDALRAGAGMGVGGAGGATSVAPGAAPRGAGAATGPDFAATLGRAIESAASTEQRADALGDRLAHGDPDVAIDQVMIAAEQAAITLRYAVTLKNHAVEAYRELMNTPV